MNKKIAPLQFITPDLADKNQLEKLVYDVCKNGCRWVQLRLKKCSDNDFLEIARSCLMSGIVVRAGRTRQMTFTLVVSSSSSKLWFVDSTLLIPPKASSSRPLMLSISLLRKVSFRFEGQMHFFR